MGSRLPSRHCDAVFHAGWGCRREPPMRVMYIWLDYLKPVLTIIRTGRGFMMGVGLRASFEPCPFDLPFLPC